jgi:hypothetical protein
MTPAEHEIMRLWGVIQRLTRPIGINMNDKEEAVFGEVYQEFKRVRTDDANETLNGLNCNNTLRADLTATAAACLRALYNLGEPR